MVEIQTVRYVGKVEIVLKLPLHFFSRLPVTVGSAFVPYGRTEGEESNPREGEKGDDITFLPPSDVPRAGHVKAARVFVFSGAGIADRHSGRESGNA